MRSIKKYLQRKVKPTWKLLLLCLVPSFACVSFSISSSLAVFCRAMCGMKGLYNQKWSFSNWMLGWGCLNKPTNKSATVGVPARVNHHQDTLSFGSNICVIVLALQDAQQRTNMQTNLCICSFVFVFFGFACLMFDVWCFNTFSNSFCIVSSWIV